MLKDFLKANAFGFAILACAPCAFAGFNVEIDLNAQPLKDVRASTCGPIIGYAGSLLTRADRVGGDVCWAVSNRLGMSRAFPESGAWLQRVWNANAWFARRGSNPYDSASTDREELKRYRSYRQSDPGNAFGFWKDNGIKVLFTLEAWGGERSKQEIVEFVDFIVSNKYESVVAGFELGNESFYAKAEAIDRLCKTWNEVIPEIVKRMPNVRLGIPVCELFENNPDLTQVRDRMLAAGEINRETYFAANVFNQTSARMIVNLKPSLDKISHVIYHAYGAESPYSCSYYGFQRFRNFAEAFPEIKGKKLWLSEVRPRSDEDNRCQRIFRETLIMAHYALMAICQPEVDGFNHHQLFQLSGGLYLSDGKRWPILWRDAGGEYPDFRSPCDAPHLEVGSMGVAWRIYTEAIKTHPLIMAHGTSKEINTEKAFFTSAQVCDQVYARRRAIKEKRTDFLGRPDIPKVEGEVEWTALASANRSEVCFLMVNSKPNAETLTVRIPGCQFAAPTYVTLSCPEQFVDCRDVPGDGKPWRQVSWEDTQSGFDVVQMEKYEGMSPVCDEMTVTIEPNTVQSVTVVTRAVPKRR